MGEIMVAGTAFAMPQGRGMIAIVPDDSRLPVMVADGSRDQDLFWSVVGDISDEPPTGDFMIRRNGETVARMKARRPATPEMRHAATMRLISFLNS